MRRSTLTLLLLLGACSQQTASPGQGSTEAASPSGESEAPNPTASSAWKSVRDPNVLTPQGLGAIEVGEAPPATLKPAGKPAGAQVSDGCRIYPDTARRVYAMTDGKVVARVTAMGGSPVRTAEGIAVGASEAAVRQAYPQAVETPHKYAEAPAKYLDWRPGGGTMGLRFEIDARGRVGAIHAGREPEIEYVEGCA